MKPYLLFSLIISWALLSAIVKHDHQNVDHASLCTDTIPGQTDYEKALAFNDEYINQGNPHLWDSVLLYMNNAIAVQHVEASAFMGHFFLFKQLASEMDTAYGLNLLRFAADKNSYSAIYDLGIYMFCTGKYVEGERYLLKADSLGHPFALYELSTCYSRGEPSVCIVGCQSNAVPLDKEKELKYCIMASGKGNLEAQVDMMYHYKRLNEESAFRCMVLRILNNEDFMSEENVNTRDDIDMFLTEEYGASYRDTIALWFCE